MLQHIYTFTDRIPHTTSISHTTQYTSLQIHLHLTKLLLSFCFILSDSCAQVTTVSLLSLSGCLVRRHLDTCGGDQINLGVPTIGTQLDESRATSNHRSHHQEWAPRRVVIFWLNWLHWLNCWIDYYSYILIYSSIYYYNSIYHYNSCCYLQLLQLLTVTLATV